MHLNPLKISISPSSLPCTQPLTCIEYEDLKDGMLDMINRNSNILPTVVDEFNHKIRLMRLLWWVKWSWVISLV